MRMARFIFLAAVFAVFGFGTASAQSTEFTYQGKLNDGAVAANANYDFEFRLFDALAAGGQVGPLLTRTNVAVEGGIFSVKLDFGGVFAGADRFLEIRVRTAGGAGYTVLDPRQKLNSAPYGIRSLVAETANNANNLGGFAASQYVRTNDARLSDDRNPLAGSNNYIRNSVAAQPASFNIGGSGSIAGSLSVATATGTLSVGGNTTVQGNLTVGGSLTANLPAGDSSYVQNRTSVQTGTNFNVSGTGTANVFAATQFNGGNFSGVLYNGSVFNSTNGFFQDNVRILGAPGTNNTFAGRLSGSANTGTDNSFFGFNAGNNNTSSNNNTFVGSEAGSLNTGDVNTFIGAAAGKNNILGSDNTFVGTAAGLSNSGGNQNTFVGRSAGRLNISSVANTFVGYRSGQNTLSGANSFFGSEAGALNTGALNAFFGERSGYLNTGDNNAFFGRYSGSDNTSGTQNTFIGSASGPANTTGGNNVFIGFFAGLTNTTGSSNTFIGSGSYSPNVDITYATAIGSGAVALQSNSVTLGRTEDIVYVPGFIRVAQLGSAGATSLCRNSNNTIGSCSSSLRYKTNIGQFGLGIDIVNQLKPITFDWKDGGMHDLGLGAEDVAAIEPLLVTYNKDGQVEGVKYDRIGVVLVNAVKEQQTQIEKLAEQNRKQQSLIESLVRSICGQNPNDAICKELK